MLVLTITNFAVVSKLLVVVLRQAGVVNVLGTLNRGGADVHGVFLCVSFFLVNGKVV